MNYKLKIIKTLSLIVLLPSLLLISCNKENEETRVWKEQWVVGPALRHITTWAEGNGDYLEIKRNGSDTWTVYPNAVDGFDYEEGYEYEILVKGSLVPDPVVDRPPTEYSLIKILSKKEITRGEAEYQ